MEIVLEKILYLSIKLLYIIILSIGIKKNVAFTTMDRLRMISYEYMT
jgi:hypothetical protein